MKKHVSPYSFRKASLQQLMQIIRHEDCEITYKAVAEFELVRRSKEVGIPIRYDV